MTSQASTSSVATLLVLLLVLPVLIREKYPQKRRPCPPAIRPGRHDATAQQAGDASARPCRHAHVTAGRSAVSAPGSVLAQVIGPFRNQRLVLRLRRQLTGAGCVRLRVNGRLHRLGVGRTRTGTRALLLVRELHIRHRKRFRLAMAPKFRFVALPAPANIRDHARPPAIPDALTYFVPAPA